MQPYPDRLLDALPDDNPGPEARVEQNEAVTLAFVTTLQLLTPRARAVLILRDVLGFSARDAAKALDTTEDAVAMTLSRARAALRGTSRSPLPPHPRPGTAAEETMAHRLAEALTTHDINTVVRLLADDVRITMPPLPAIWHGRQQAAEFLAEVAFRLVPEARFIETRANRHPPLPSTPATTATGSGAPTASSSSPCAPTRLLASPGSSHTHCGPSACRAFSATMIHLGWEYERASVTADGSPGGS